MTVPEVLFRKSKIARISSKLVLGFSGYVVLAVVLSRYLDSAALSRFEDFLSLFIAPLHFIFRPIYPLLDYFGLLSGEYWVLPSITGFVVGTFFYDLFLVLCCLALACIRSRRKN